MNTLKASNLTEIQKIVQAHSSILPRGGGSKSALSTPSGDSVCLDLSELSGIIEYEPGEYTFTAYAGTPVQTVADELAKHAQYMPFDPIFAQRGATLGGTVAANSSGSGRYRYGGVRDFILGVHFVDGRAQLVRSGGKVVKNSAGFDLSKFMVGSLGRYGILVQLSFKVFPQPQRYMTLVTTFSDINSALQAVLKLASSPLELDALDIELAANKRYVCLIRLGGLAEGLPGRLTRLQQYLSRHTSVREMQSYEEAAEQALWHAPLLRMGERASRPRFLSSPAGTHSPTVPELACGQPLAEAPSLVKVPLAPKQVPLLDAELGATPRRYTAGGNVAWIASQESSTLATKLKKLGLIGLQLIGNSNSPYLGQPKGVALAQRVKQALDPDGKFMPLPEGTG
jgi:glycolate oxidase FAD binding subunit